jgi:hypothetical protein
MTKRDGNIGRIVGDDENIFSPLEYYYRERLQKPKEAKGSLEP